MCLVNVLFYLTITTIHMKKYSLLFICTLACYMLSAQCADTGNYWNQSWVSCTTSPNPNPLRGDQSHWLLYEFDEAHYIDSTYIWNANRAGESGWGAKDVVIDFSTDGTTWEELGAYEFSRAPETDTYEGFLGPDFGGRSIQKVLITILSTHEVGACVSIAEIRFQIDQDACYGVVDACGVCDGPGELTWFLDADADGLGDPNSYVLACTQPNGYVADSSDLCDNGYLGWVDVARVFEDNGCLNCHGAGAQGGLDLRSYETTAAGGNICGTSLLTGTKLVDIITISAYDGCGTPMPAPSMNLRISEPLEDQEIALIQEWVNGGAPEICTDYCPNYQAEIPYNGMDDDCDPETLDDDLDQDGFVLAEDCDDQNANINPDQMEIPYNGFDDDCNVATLDDDLDQDGFGLADDCDDQNPAINPNADEIPNNGIDEDCDGSDLITSTLELANSTIHIFPNPTIDQINIQVDGYLQFEAALYSLDGKKIRVAENPTSFQLKDLPSGTYLLEMIDLDSKGKAVKKIVKVDQ